MTRSHAARLQVLILGFDTFARKNVTQVRALEAEGYAFTIVTNDQRGDSRDIFEAQGFAASRLVVVRGVLDKIATAWRVLRNTRFNHVELGPAGRMALVYLLMLKVLRIPFLVIERGDVGALATYDLLTRTSLKLAYRFAERIIYKETYMEKLLGPLSSAPLHFIPNCVPRAPILEAARTIDFLWVNRVIRERPAQWVINASEHASLSHCRIVLLGIEDRDNIPRHIVEEQRRVLTRGTANVTLLRFTDPGSYYRTAKFFCLPGSLVFGNNALLEAMASGVVPVVTEAPGVELVVQDGVNGIVTRCDEDAYREGMIRAAALSEAEWRRLSRKTVEQVREKFSVEAWTRKMADVYAKFAV